MFENLRILDTTLRDGEQTPGVLITSNEKLKIALKLDELGVDVIEAGSAITSNDEQKSIKTITENNLNADGSVNIPVVLRPYMGGKEKLIPTKK